MPLRLHNTLTRQTEPLVPLDPSNVTFYSCGPTVYDDAHIGNFRSFLLADTLRRWIQSPLCELTDAQGAPLPGPRRVTHVMNITDVGHMTDDDDPSGAGEDKMQQASRRLLEAKKAGKLPADAKIDPTDPYAVARFYADRFLEDARTLGLKVAAESQRDPTLMPRPTQRIPQMVAMIEELIRRGHAYAVGPSGRQTVYYDVQSFPPYGQLSGNTLDAVRAGAGGRISDENQAEKRHPADFMLWKSDPAHVMKWPSPWGAGYPGWHIECSAMARDRLGPQIDLHSGGEDNIFPHHECEIAQSCGATGLPTFARIWFHVRHLFVEGQKMSKSKGNFFTARDMFARGVEPAALRMELVKTHYRTNANFTMQGLTDNARIIDRWRRFIAAAPSGDPAASRAARDAARAGFADAMNDDLNIAAAIAEVNKFVSAVESPSPDDAALLKQFDAALGLLELPRPEAARTDIGVFLGGLAPDPAVVALLEDRAAARKSKDFARSDAIRDQLLSMGYAIKDVAGGKVEVTRAR